MRLAGNHLFPAAGLPTWGLCFTTGVLISGAASLINEVVWQRAFQRFLGGSETLSSMLVVAAFLSGLGVGSILAGRYAGRFRVPIGALAWVELALAVTTLLIALGLRSGNNSGVIGLQLSAIEAGLPISVVFGCLTGMVLFIPCCLMGATLPLASEALQRALGARNSRALGVLFGVNTIGAAAGAIAAGYALAPLFGISSSLYCAVALNLLAAVLFLATSWAATKPGGRALNEMDAATVRVPGDFSFRWSAFIMLVLGFCSLGYEMALLRLFALKWGPLPYTFALVITGYLVAWSVGAALSSRAQTLNIAPLAGFCALALLLPLAAYYLWWLSAGNGISAAPEPMAMLNRPLRRVLAIGCFVPGGVFGLLFGTVTARAARTWGRDVGRLYAANTVGAVAGCVAIPLAGYELPFPALIAALMAALFLLQYFESKVSGLGGWLRPSTGRPGRIGALAAVGTLAALLVVASALQRPLRAGLSLWFGRAGVLGLDRDGNLIWDGLWHSQLAEGSSYIGTNNWNMAALPVVSYSGPGIRDVCVIGLGTGITAAVIAKLVTVRKVKVYEINRGLEEFHREYPVGTLHALDHPKIEISWQDARAGLQIRNERFDLIVTQPLYLRQAGSTFLNSREFLEIVRSRLNPGGVFCLYSRGNRAQQLVMRETAASVFRYGESFMQGYLLVLSDSPFDLSKEALERRFVRFREDPFWREIAANAKTSSPIAVRALLDHPRLDWSAWGLSLTDDDPLIEYPGMLDTRLKWAREAAR